jgi:hypothetical protein
MTQEEIERINSHLAAFFLRSGIALRLVESDAFKQLVEALNPGYACHMPCAKTLSGPMLDQQYQKYKTVLDGILQSSESLTLISDGWTNVRGDHIVNFCISSPDQKPFFYSSVNTSGISQDSPGVAKEILNVIDFLGPEKFIAVVTDNAPVMKAAWKLIENRYPHISALLTRLTTTTTSWKKEL